MKHKERDSDKERTMILLLSVIMVILLVNLYGTFNLYNVIDNVKEDIVADQSLKGTLKIIQNTVKETSPSDKMFDDDAVKGDPDAPVTIVEFSDFECPFCGRFYSQTLPHIEEDYIKTGKVKIIFRDFPLGFHRYAQKASEAAECAHQQGKFWEFHNKLYENQDSLDIQSLKEYAADLGLDTQKFNSCLDSGEMAPEVQADFMAGQAAGISGTPSFFINGQKIVGAQPYAVFRDAIESALKS